MFKNFCFCVPLCQGTLLLAVFLLITQCASIYNSIRYANTDFSIIPIYIACLSIVVDVLSIACSLMGITALAFVRVQIRKYENDTLFHQILSLHGGSVIFEIRYDIHSDAFVPQRFHAKL
ncbi:hypothetical protein HK096_008921 [Nowakowskiella sp. JEL0078]|nr:hypothetical protein HK096_008921 [Nowakowskiella sp. JEL0078]